MKRNTKKKNKYVKKQKKTKKREKNEYFRFSYVLRVGVVTVGLVTVCISAWDSVSSE